MCAFLILSIPLTTTAAASPAALGAPATISGEARLAPMKLIEEELFHDWAGNLREITDRRTNTLEGFIETRSTQRFEYDALHRLEQAQGAYGAEDFRYSATGDLLRMGDVHFEDVTSPWVLPPGGPLTPVTRRTLRRRVGSGAWKPHADFSLAGVATRDARPSA